VGLKGTGESIISFNAKVASNRVCCAARTHVTGYNRTSRHQSSIIEAPSANVCQVKDQNVRKRRCHPHPMAPGNKSAAGDMCHTHTRANQANATVCTSKLVPRLLGGVGVSAL